MSATLGSFYWLGFETSGLSPDKKRLALLGAQQLYVTAKGNWFLYGWGGAMTKYAEHEGNSSSEGERIVPMTRDEALAWCEEHKAQDAIDKHFSDLVSEA